MRLHQSAALALLFTLPLAACSSSDDDDGGGDGIDFTNVADTEPNDAPGQAQILGLITPGEGFRVTAGMASFEDDGAMDDEFDSFNITADGDQRIVVRVSHDVGIDIDLAFVDMATGEILPPEDCDTDTSPERCEFTLLDAQSVNVEAEAFSGTGSYTLRIESYSL